MTRFDESRLGGATRVAGFVLLLALLAACSDSDPVGPDPWPAEESTWQALGEGLTGSAAAFVEWEGELIVGGRFRTAGDQPARNVARWDGDLWHPLGKGLDGTVQDLAVHQGDLVAAGLFGGSLETGRVLRWTGEQWEPVGLLQAAGIMSLAVHDGMLYAQGVDVSRWTGSGWEAAHVQVDGEFHEAEPPMAVHENHLIVAVGSEQLARWDGQAWEWIERPQGLLDLVAGNGELYAQASGVSRFLRWTGSGWEDLPSLPSRRSWTIHAGRLVVGVDGGVSGHRVLWWDGSEWTPVPGGIDGPVYGLGSFGSALLAGGDFTAIDGRSFRGVAGIVPSWATAHGGS